MVASVAVLAVALVVGVVGPVAPASAAPTSGVDDWSCRPSAAHPSPVVVVHGTFGDSSTLLRRLKRSVAAAGYCVFALDYGRRATGPVEQSAQELSAYVDRVLAATGARRVSLVGHSQGGMMPRYYVRFLGGAAKVDDVVGLAPSNHGTRTPLLLAPGLGVLCPACLQQARGSDFLAALNQGDETPAPVSWTTVVTRLDEVVLPYGSGFLDGATNVTLQRVCPLHLPGHLLLPSDGAAIRITLDALGRPGPADPGFRPSCAP